VRGLSGQVTFLSQKGYHGQVEEGQQEELQEDQGAYAKAVIHLPCQGIQLRRRSQARIRMVRLEERQDQVERFLLTGI
jgi:hypothetical protein